MRRMRRSLDAAVITAASRRIQATILDLPEFKQATSIAAYLALPYEVQMNLVIETAWALDKKVCVPAFREDANRYELTWIGPEDKLQPGRYNIAEPSKVKKVHVTDVDLLVVPALAYDKTGGRLGHGGGHYDRILGCWSGIRVGVAFGFQVFDRIPMGEQDIPVDLVVTEAEVYKGEV